MASGSFQVTVKNRQKVVLGNHSWRLPSLLLVYDYIVKVFVHKLKKFYFHFNKIIIKIIVILTCPPIVYARIHLQHVYNYVRTFFVYFGV